MHYLELIKLKLERKVLYQLLQNLPTPVELVITQADDYVKMGLTSQLINRISRVLQKLLNFFNGTIILTFFYYYYY